MFQVCIAYDTGYIPPNLHYENPREDLPAITEGRMAIVTEKTKFNRGLTGINSFGFGGANAHVLLKNYTKEKVIVFLNHMFKVYTKFQYDFFHGQG